MDGLRFTLHACNSRESPSIDMLCKSVLSNEGAERKKRYEPSEGPSLYKSDTTEVIRGVDRQANTYYRWIFHALRKAGKLVVAVIQDLNSRNMIYSILHLELLCGLLCSLE